MNSHDAQVPAPRSKATSYSEVPMNLTQDQWEWLESMASKHKLSSMSKAVRCCINCIALGDVDESSAAPNNGKDGDGVITTTKQVGLSKEQISWLAERGEDYCVSSQILATCMAMEEYTVFGIIRCKTSIAKCEGAKEAVHNIGEQYGQNESEVVVKENIDILSKKDCGCAKK
eukprot:66044_1